DVRKGCVIQQVLRNRIDGLVNRSNLQKVHLPEVAACVPVLENTVPRILLPNRSIARDLIGQSGDFNRSEEERAITSVINVRDRQWPTEAAAELVFNLSGPRYCVLVAEKRIGVQDLIPVEFKQASMELVGTGWRDHVYLSCTRPGIRMGRACHNPKFS